MLRCLVGDGLGFVFRVLDVPRDRINTLRGAASSPMQGRSARCDATVNDASVLPPVSFGGKSVEEKPAGD